MRSARRLKLSAVRHYQCGDGWPISRCKNGATLAQQDVWGRSGAAIGPD